MTTPYLTPTLNTFSWQPSVKDKDILTPPGGPVKGDRYIIGGTGAGGWSGHNNVITYWNGSIWVYLTPITGWICWVVDESLYYVYNGSSWVTFPVANPLVMGNYTITAYGNTALGNLFEVDPNGDLEPRTALPGVAYTSGGIWVVDGSGGYYPLDSGVDSCFEFDGNGDLIPRVS